MLTFKILAAIIIFFVALLTGLLQTKIIKHRSHLLCTCDSFAGGVFMSAALLHLLPESDKALTNVLGAGYYPIAQLICLASFVIFLTMERGILLHDKHYHLNDKKTVTPLILILFLSIHSLVEGAAIGASINLAEVIMVFFAVLAHKGSESFALATNLHNNNIITNNIQKIIVIFSFITPIGIFTASFITSALSISNINIISPIFNAIAAGTFLYLGTEHLIKCKKSLETFRETTPLILGVIIMALAAIWF